MGLNINVHGVTVEYAKAAPEYKTALVRDRDGNQVQMFFDHLEDMELLAQALTAAADDLRDHDLGRGQVA